MEFRALGLTSGRGSKELAAEVQVTQVATLKHFAEKAGQP